MVSKFSSIHDRELTILVSEPKIPLFCFGTRTHGLDIGTSPNWGMTPSTPSLTPLILFSVSDLSDFGFVFQVLSTGIKSATCEDIEETADSASALARVAVAGGSTMGGKIPPPVMMGSATVTPDLTTTVVTMPMVTPARVELVLVLFPVEDTDAGKVVILDSVEPVPVGTLALNGRLEPGEESVVSL